MPRAGAWSYSRTGENGPWEWGDFFLSQNLKDCDEWIASLLFVQNMQKQNMLELSHAVSSYLIHLKLFSLTLAASLCSLACSQEVVIDWQAQIRPLKTTPAFQTVVNPVTCRESPYHDAVYQKIASLQSPFARYVPWCVYVACLSNFPSSSSPLTLSLLLSHSLLFSYDNHPFSFWEQAPLPPPGNRRVGASLQ